MQATAERRRVRVLIADDHSVIRRMVRSTLESHPHFEVCGEAEDGVQAIKAAEELKPDVVVLNITMPVMDGFQAARQIKARIPESAIVILSTHADQGFIEEAKKIGVQGYVTKTQVGGTLLQAVDAVLRKETFFPDRRQTAEAMLRPA